MKITYKSLEREFDLKVKKLQATCKHKNTTWLKEAWAIAHYTGKDVKICNCCNKRLEKRDSKID